MTDDLVARLRSKAREFIAPSVIDEAADEIERLRYELSQADHRSFQAGRICYRGFSYGVGSQGGVDSLRRAIQANGHG